MSLPQAPSARGAAPGGATDEKSAGIAVQRMFNEIAPRYDLLNHILSCNVDRMWWNRVAVTFSPILEKRDARILDLCCGTGDMALALWRRRKRVGGANLKASSIVAADFAHSMLTRAERKFAGKEIAPVEADALGLPFAQNQFDLVVSAFGFRNLANYDSGLREIYRVLRPGGQMGILEFGEPHGLMGLLYGFYFRKILPAVGTVVGGVKGPYSYLPASVSRFPTPQEMQEQMAAAGFIDIHWTPYTGRIAGLYRGARPR